MCVFYKMDNDQRPNNLHGTVPHYRARRGEVASIVIFVSNVFAVVFNFAQDKTYIEAYVSCGVLFFMVSNRILDIKKPLYIK